MDFFSDSNSFSSDYVLTEFRALTFGTAKFKKKSYLSKCPCPNPYLWPATYGHRAFSVAGLVPNMTYNVFGGTLNPTLLLQ